MFNTRARIGAALLAAVLMLPALLSPTSVEAGVDDLDDEEIAAVIALNEVRADLGLPAFSVSPILTETAEWMAQDLADRDLLDHTDSLGRGLRARFNAFGYPANSFIRENLAAGYDTGAEVMVGWQNSPGHKANNEASDVIAIGIARVFSPGSDYGWFWALTFGSIEDAGTIEVGTEVTPPADPPIGTGIGTFRSDFPNSGVGLNIWNGGTITQLAQGGAQGGAQTIFVSIDGEVIGYVIGAPAFVNARFEATYPNGTVPAGTIVIVVV